MKTAKFKMSTTKKQLSLSLAMTNPIYDTIQLPLEVYNNGVRRSKQVGGWVCTVSEM